MSAVEVIFIFAGIPLGIAAIVWGLISIGSPSGAGRYHLGDKWTSAPLWFVGHPRKGVTARPEQLIETDARALEEHETARAAGSSDTVHGGASGSW